MAVKKQGNLLEEYVKNLTRSFQRWDDIFENGCADPFHCDGVNLNLVRNHIIYEKKQIEEFLKDERENTLFSTPYPDIYYKPTPEQVPYDFMVNPDKIRSRAADQLRKYEEDINFCYIRDHYKEAFPNGETKATKAAGILPGKFYYFIAFRDTIEKDDLVRMRSLFSTPYEDRIKELSDCADELRKYLSTDHSHDDNSPVQDDFYDEEYEEVVSATKTSLDEKICVAKAKAENQEISSEKHQEKQLSFFDF